MQDEIRDALTAAKAGDEQALAAMITKFMPIIRRAAGRCACPGLEYDDLVQEGIIALFHAIGAYSEQRGAAFATYAQTCIENAAVSAVRAATRQKHTPLNTFVPLNEADRADAVRTPEDLLLASERYSDAMQDIATRLSPLERQVLAAFLDGKSYATIAKQLGLSVKAVGNALQRVRAKLR
ncbi:MAG: sigma-70 family RNA polymerase sigma factor [Ruthenibacterium sp.]